MLIRLCSSASEAIFGSIFWFIAKLLSIEVTYGTCGLMRTWVISMSQASVLLFSKHCFVHMIFLRVLGGLLSAYDLSSEPMFLKKAQQIADRLLPAWETPSGIPYNIINLASGHASNPGWTGVYNLTILCNPVN